MGIEGVPGFSDRGSSTSIMGGYFKAVRIGEGSTIEKWREHVTNLESRAVLLNDKNI